MKNNKFESFGKYLEGISRIHGRAKVFDDFLQIIVCCLSMGRKEELYFKTIKPYSKEELNLFSQAFASLIVQMDNTPLNDPFEEFLSNSKNGQFFTPIGICDLMTQLTTAVKPTEERRNGDVRVYDPACGSGRLLLSAAKQDKEQFFIGADISYVCCLMTIINLCLNSLNGEVLHINTISLECWHHWCIIVDSFTKIPTVYEINPDKLNQAPTSAIELKPNPVKGLIQPVESVPAISFVRYTAKS